MTVKWTQLGLDEKLKSEALHFAVDRRTNLSCVVNAALTQYLANPIEVPAPPPLRGTAAAKAKREAGQ